MIDREKVIKGLDACMGEIVANCEACPYNADGNRCERILLTDALALLNAQEPRVMTLDEIPKQDGAILIETRANGRLDWYFFFNVMRWEYDYEGLGDVYRTIDTSGWIRDHPVKQYEREWRAWTSRPTNKQREETQWLD